MNVWDILILAAVTAALFLAFRTAVGNRKTAAAAAGDAAAAGNTTGPAYPAGRPARRRHYEETP